MSQDTDTSNAAVRPPVAWLLALAAGVAADQLYPLRFVPASVPGGWVGGAIFAIAFALAIWAIVTIRKAGTQVETYKPTTTIVANGPYRLTRNPIYLAMVLGLIGLAIAFDSLWIVVTLVPFYLVIRYGVVAREEAYLERKFGDVYPAWSPARKPISSASSATSIAAISPACAVGCDHARSLLDRDMPSRFTRESGVCSAPLACPLSA